MVYRGKEWLSDGCDGLADTLSMLYARNNARGPPAGVARRGANAGSLLNRKLAMCGRDDGRSLLVRGCQRSFFAAASLG